MGCASAGELAIVEALFLLVPFSALLVLALIGVFAWALHAGQFDNVEHEAARILAEDVKAVDRDQRGASVSPEQ